MTSTYLAVIAATWGVAMALSPLLQIRAILANRSARAVSVAYQQVLLVGFVLIAVLLLLRPQGLLGQPEIKK